jgi:hypothetical protein
MANVLTASEAAIVLRCEATDADLLALLPLVDTYLKNATGRDWAADSTIHPAAKSAARMLLVQWHEDPGKVGSASALDFGLRAALVQLAALALQYRNFAGRSGAGPIDVPGVTAGETVSTVTGLIGVTGSQAAAFETVITIDGQIQQISTADLSANWYRAYLVPLGDL